MCEYSNGPPDITFQDDSLRLRPISRIIFLDGKYSEETVWVPSDGSPGEYYEVLGDYEPDDEGAEEPKEPAQLRLSEAQENLIEIVLCQIEVMAPREEFDKKRGEFYNMLAEEDGCKERSRLEEDRVWD